MKAFKRVLAAILILILCFGALGGAAYGGGFVYNNHLVKKANIQPDPGLKVENADRIHFLNVSGDACLLESQGHFALIGLGGKKDSPSEPSASAGYGTEILTYLRRHAADREGKICLDWVFLLSGDPANGLLPMLDDPTVKIETLYGTASSEMQAALNQRRFSVFSSTVEYPSVFGRFALSFYPVNERAEITGVKMTRGSKTAFLALEPTSPSQQKIDAALIGEVDLLDLSTPAAQAETLKILDPEVTVACGMRKKMNPGMVWRVSLLTQAPILNTMDNEGILATFSEDETLQITKQIMKNS